MSIVAPVTDGVISNTITESSNKTETSSGNQMGKEDFLQLLVAQMKYQDPLEPTSNTEYIAQYATFSEIEQMQNMSSSVNLDRASSLVGKYVYIKTTNATTGETGYKYGKVDFVQIENNEAYLSINGSLYPLEDLDSVVDQDYMDAYEKAANLVNALKKLPSVANVTVDDTEAIKAANKTYTEMTDYEKSFLDESVSKLITEYVDKLAEVTKVAEAAAKKLVEDLNSALEALPEVDKLTLEDKDAVNAANKIYTSMNSFQLGYVEKDTKTLLDSYLAKIEELEKETVTDTDTDETV
ncbi:MAG: flagellar hook capping FlgD N-terminal domain-containing protein [Lachnospiraceae bacterium]|nr:flagellar hook capping FlgD N-terminal domain-containing protein [Lachnospiraceae bacterium]